MNDTTIPNKPTFTPDEVAHIFSIKKRTVYKWHDEGKITGQSISGKCLRFHRSEIIKMLNQQDT